MGDGFTVNYDGLEQMGGDLQSLAAEFDGMRDLMSDYADAVGRPPLEIGFFSSETVADRLDRVAKNWSDERGEIVDTMEAAADYATRAAEVYRDLDTGLAGEFSGTGGGTASYD